MGLEDGQYISETEDEILDALIEDAKQYFGDDLDDSSKSRIRAFYRPVARFISDTQRDVGLVLEATQIDNAVGTSLDLLTALIGVQRIDATESIGSVVFSRDEPSEAVSYPIEEGTVVQTPGSTPIRFETVESAALPAGETSVEVEVESLESGADNNIGQNTLTRISNPPSGIQNVRNPEPTFGGTDREPDEEFRERAKGELADGTGATMRAILSAIDLVPGVQNLTIFPNNDETNLGERPGFELVVQGGNEATIGQEILDTKAAGDETYSGNFGTGIQVTGELPNGQTQEVGFSRPQSVTIYVDVQFSITDEYQGDEYVKDSITNYIGGVLSTGNTTNGEISVDDNVLYGEIDYAIRDSPGIYDIEHLHIGTAENPTGEENIEIGQTSVAETDASSISITASEQ